MPLPYAFEHYRFAYFKAPPKATATAPLAAFGWGPGDPIRTLCEFNLPELAWPHPRPSADEWIAAWSRAFDVEKVTKRFYEDYASVFESVERTIKRENNISNISSRVPAESFGRGRARLASTRATQMRSAMEQAGLRLKEYSQGHLLNGVKSGLNDAFIIDAQTRQRLLDEEEQCGDKIFVFSSEMTYGGTNCISGSDSCSNIQWTDDIRQWPALRRHLQPFRSQLDARDGVKGGGPCPWYSLSRPRPETRPFYSSPKIVYPDIGKETRFAMDWSGYMLANTESSGLTPPARRDRRAARVSVPVTHGSRFREVI